MTDIEQRFGAKFNQPESYHQVYSTSAFTYPSMPVIGNENTNVIEYYQWGLIPFWTKNDAAAYKIRQHTLNARAETIFNKPSFRHSIHSKRCLIIADGFFEWRHENRKTYPYYITLASKAPFAIAGIWDSWKKMETTETVKIFSVITTRANPLLEQIHNTRKRMPVILQREHEKRWLDSELGEAEIQSMLISYNEEKLSAHTVSNMIMKLGHNTTNPEVLEKRDYPELPEIT